MIPSDCIAASSIIRPGSLTHTECSPGRHLFGSERSQLDLAPGNSAVAHKKSLASLRGFFVILAPRDWRF